MITKTLSALFAYSILFEFTDFVRLKRSDRLKGVRNLFDLSSYSTYPEFNLSGVFFVHKACHNQGKYKNVRDWGSSTQAVVDLSRFNSINLLSSIAIQCLMLSTTQETILKGPPHLSDSTLPCK